jgi:hypothetical protein
MPFNEPIHDFFDHFDVIFENSEKYLFLQNIVKQLKTFFENNSADKIGISKVNYEFIKKQMELYLIITVDNASGFSLSQSRAWYLSGENLFWPLKRLHGEFGELLLKKLFQITSPYDRLQRSEATNDDVLLALVIHAITFGRSYTNDPLTKLEYPPLNGSNPFEPSLEFIRFAEYFAQDLKNHETKIQPNFEKMKSAREIRDEIAEAIRKR